MSIERFTFLDCTLLTPNFIKMDWERGETGHTPEMILVGN